MVRSVATALVSSRLDNTISILYNIAHKFQRIQNTVGTAVPEIARVNSNDAIRSLLWLPIDKRINSKLFSPLASY